MVIPLIIGAYTVFDLALYFTTGKDTVTTVTGVDVWGTVLSWIPGFNDTSSTVEDTATSTFDPMLIVVFGFAIILLYLLCKKKKNKDKKVKN